MSTYEAALRGVSSRAVLEAAQRFTLGEVEGQSRTFAPSVAEFVQEARKRQEYLDLRNRPRLPAPVYRRGKLAPFEVLAEKARAANAHLPILHADVSYDTFLALHRAGKLPVGAKWVAALSTIFGPEVPASASTEQAA